MYLDGQNNRYLLGGAWLFRPDRSDVGLAQGWARDVCRDRWLVGPVGAQLVQRGRSDQPAWPVTSAGTAETSPFPSDAFAKYVAAGDRHWIIRFESVNYRATVWLNGRQIGTHARRVPPVRIRPEESAAGGQPADRARRQPPQGRRTFRPVPVGAGGTTAASSARSTCERWRGSTSPSCSSGGARPVSACSAVVSEQATLRNLSSRRQTVRLHGAYGTAPIDFGTRSLAPASTLVAQAVATIRHPRLWSPDHPNLYRATLTARRRAATARSAAG